MIQSSSLTPLYKVIETPLNAHIVRASIDWRNDNPTFFHRVAISLTMVSSAFLGVVDSIASLALSILFSPLELAGCQFSRNFFKRSIISGLCTGLSLTVMQYDNFAKQRIRL